MAGAIVELGEEDSGRAVKLDLGGVMAVELGENASTGYRWQVESDGAPVLRLAGDAVDPAGGAAGAGGRRRLRFEAVAAGRSAIRIVLRRAWEPGEPRRVFTAAVEVAG